MYVYVQYIHYESTLLGLSSVSPLKVTSKCVCVYVCVCGLVWCGVVWCVCVCVYVCVYVREGGCVCVYVCE